MKWSPSVAAAALFGVFSLSGCAPKPGDTQVIARVKSPDGKLEAVYAADLGGGAAVGATEEVFVIQPGIFPQLRERVFSEECAHHLTMAWEAPRTLRVDYDVTPDVRDEPLTRPSLRTIFSSGYWTFEHPHGVSVRLARHLSPSESGC